MPMECPYCHEQVEYSEYINHMETKHPEVVGKELARPSAREALARAGGNLKEMYLTILDRFRDEEEKGIRDYENLLIKINQSKQAAVNAGSPEEVLMPLTEMYRQVHRIIEEERTHLDTINAMKQMLQGT